jgi:predicted transposase YdaD
LKEISVAKAADIGGKRLISLAPDAWVEWVTQQPDLTVQEILGSEFQWVSRENDVLIKVTSPQHGEFLILNELQLRYSDRMPVRIRTYTALAEEKYGLPVYPILINILPPAATTIVSNHFESNFLGLQARQEYRVINLWEVEAAIVFEQQLIALMPFVPILKGGGETRVVQQALSQLRSDQQLVELESLLAFFASFVLETEVVRQIMRWDMAVLRESPWYQEIEQRGRQEGLEEGLQHERSLILRLLTRKLGELPEAQRSQISTLPQSDLEALGEALLDFVTLSDLSAWLQSQA